MRHLLRGTLLALATLAVLPATALAAEGGGLRTFVWHSFNLALLLGIIGYFARTPLRELMATRRTKIESDLGQARADLERAESQLREWKNRMDALDSELDEIRGAVRAQAEGERDRIVADAEASAERIRANAVAAVEQETRRARELLREEGAELAIERAGEILQQRITGDDRDRLFGEFLNHLQNAPDDLADASQRS